METSFAPFMETRHLTTLRRATAELGLRSYLVGGCLRDLALGREVNDVDIAVAGGAEKVSRRFAKECGGTFFWLDQERGHSRVIIKGGGETVTFDFAPLRGEDIFADLALRDFTINSLAVPLQGEAALIDPLGGAADIREKVVRRCSASAFRDDPLRLVRAFRFAAPSVFASRRHPCGDSASAPLVARRGRADPRRAFPESQAGSRISFAKWAAPASRSVFGLESSRILQTAEPIDMVEEVVDSFSRAADETAEKIGMRMRVEAQSGVTVLALMKLAAFIDAAGIAPRVSADHLKLGKAAGQIIETLCRASALALAEHKDNISAYRFFNSCDPAGLELPLQLLARGHITELRCRELARYYLHSHIPRGGSLLLSGAEIMALLSVAPGKIVGEAHELLREAQCTGEVRTDAEARAFLRKKLLTTNEPMG